jgi:hypothetical protein
MKTVRRWLVTVVVALALAPNVVAAPRSREDEAETEMVKAKQAMAQGRYEVAVGHLLVARSLAPDASGPYLNLGIAYERLGRCSEAVPMLEEYLRRKAKEPHPSAAEALAACRATTAETAPPSTTSPPTAPSPPTAASPPTAPSSGAAPPPTPTVTLPPPIAPTSLAPPAAPLPPPIMGAPLPSGRLTVRLDPVSGNVVLNGQRIGTDAREVERELAPGRYDIRAERDGYEPASLTGWLAPGGANVELLTLLRRKRAWPTAVGVVAGVVAFGAIVAIVVTQVNSSVDSGSPPPSHRPPSNGPAPGPSETPFPTVTTP